MFEKLLRFLFRRKQHRQKSGQAGTGTTEERISSRLQANCERIKDAFGNSPDLVLRNLETGDKGKISVLVVHIDGLCDKRLVSETIIGQVTGINNKWGSPKQAYMDLKDRILSASGVREVDSLDEFINHVICLGLFGVVAGMFALLIHLTALRSFGVPFLEPLAPIVLSDLKDALIRVPWWALNTRPKLVGRKEPIRQAPGLRPKPPSQDEKEVHHLEDKEGGK